MKTNKIYCELYFKQVYLLFDCNTASHSILGFQGFQFRTIAQKFSTSLNICCGPNTVKNGLGILLIVYPCNLG